MITVGQAPMQELGDINEFVRRYFKREGAQFNVVHTEYSPEGTIIVAERVDEPRRHRGEFLYHIRWGIVRDGKAVQAGGHHIAFTTASEDRIKTGVDQARKWLCLREKCRKK